MLWRASSYFENHWLWYYCCVLGESSGSKPWNCWLAVIFLPLSGFRDCLVLRDLGTPVQGTVSTELGRGGTCALTSLHILLFLLCCPLIPHHSLLIALCGHILTAIIPPPCRYPLTPSMNFTVPEPFFAAAWLSWSWSTVHIPFSPSTVSQHPLCISTTQPTASPSTITFNSQPNCQSHPSASTLLLSPHRQHG